MPRFRLLLLAVPLLSSCASPYWDPTVKVSKGEGHVGVVTGGAEAAAAEQPPSIVLSGVPEAASKEPPKQQRFPGTGRFVKPVAAPPVAETEGDITLNFDNHDLREVVQLILGDLLGVNYILDPAVQGTVTIQTSKPLRRDLLLPTLETLLRMNKAALVLADGVYRVLPVGSAMQGSLVPQLGDSSRPLPQGYSLRIVPLRYIGVTEMTEILKPLAPEGSIVRADPVRNLLILAGTSPELGSLLDTIEVFDVDWIKGLSVGVFRLEYGKVGEVAKQLDTLMGGKEGNPLAGLFRVVPLEATNSLLVITSQDRYLDRIGSWIERLDQAGGQGDEERLYVYRVKHGDAENLASIIGQLFTGKGAETRAPARVAPGLQASRIGGQSTSGEKTTPAAAGQGTTTRATRTATAPTSISLESGVSIVADAVNNSLLIRSTPSEYRKIREALDELDIQPLQVLVEATIVEVTLSGELRYGLQWFFTTRHGGKKGTWVQDNEQGLGPLYPGFNWTLEGITSGDVYAVLSAFAGDNLINVLSSPSIMVLDNRTAKIQVGNQVPILSQQQQGTSETDRVVNSIDYTDTGVMLSVTPRVTPGGLVIMDVEQQVSNVGEPPTGVVVDSPTISKRNIVSSVAVRHNQAVVLGGLIQDDTRSNQGGVPGLYNMPLLGWAFGQSSKSATRRELVVILTPRVITGEQDIERINDEFRGKLRGLREKF
jgi:general secretion pathway protein D